MVGTTTKASSRDPCRPFPTNWKARCLRVDRLATQLLSMTQVGTVAGSLIACRARSRESRQVARHIPMTKKRRKKRKKKEEKRKEESSVQAHSKMVFCSASLQSHEPYHHHGGRARALSPSLPASTSPPTPPPPTFLSLLISRPLQTAANGRASQIARSSV